MPTNVVKTKKDEQIWARAKALVHKQYPELTERDDRFWRITQTIFRNIKGNKKRKSKKGSIVE
ncbi:MAG: hypothetical protein U9R36_04890 [Elusimicrobiota bacterium]|nr:hypothetical protein [Elusimicrobiota bacterium]